MMLYLTDPTSHTHNKEIQNIGDVIIKDAILDNFPVEDFKNSVSWVPIDFTSKNISIKSNDYLILAGANIIANKPWFNSFVWRPNRKSFIQSNYLILFGVGWWQYQGNPGFLTKIFYNRYLVKKDVFHSVRDSYTKVMLEKAGISNVLNTGCPTMWKLPEKMDFQKKPEKVVFTITDYNRDSKNDQKLVEILLQEYRGIYFFPQGTEDLDYLNTLINSEQKTKIIVLKRDIESYNEILKGDIDYVGTRLHAGIRALQKNKRAIVISIDNRAIEIAKDTGLLIASRKDITHLPKILNENLSLVFTLNRKAISEYKDSLKRFIVKK